MTPLFICARAEPRGHGRARARGAPPSQAFRDIPAPDMGTNAQVMAWAMDTYMNTVGMVSKQTVMGVVTGKPITSGGTYGRDKATGQGLVYCVQEWSDRARFKLEGR
jgi:glutamate dehydrogenase (NAD(P)+)